MAKHLTIRHRVIIQHEIENNPTSSLQILAHKLEIDHFSLYREIQRIRISFGSRSLSFNHRKPLDCHHLARFPYVCNRCRHRNKCSKEIWEYDAVEAHSKAQYLLQSSRSKPSLFPPKLSSLDDKVSYRLQQGQSINHIIASDHTLRVSRSTLRRYIGQGYLSARNIDLPLTVRFKVHKPSKAAQRKRIDIKLLVYRTYQDYLDYQASQPRVFFS